MNNTPLYNAADEGTKAKIDELAKKYYTPENPMSPEIMEILAKK